MDPVTFVLVCSTVGGTIIAATVFRLQRPSSRVDAGEDLRISTDVINAARIRVAGIGGLGLVAMAATVAWNVPAIRVAVGTGMLLGLVFAVALIARRRSSGLPSSGQRSGANTTLAIDQRPAAPDDAITDAPSRPSRLDASLPAERLAT